MKGHPIREVIEQFKTHFSDCCMVLLSKDSDCVQVGFEEKMNYVKETILRTIHVFVDAALIFYGFETLIKPIDLKRELFFNLLANFIIEGNLYFLVFNLISNCYEDDLLKLRKVMNSQEILENMLPMKKLHVQKQFQFDIADRENYARET